MKKNTYYLPGLILACLCSFVFQNEPFQPMKDIAGFKAKLTQTNQSVTTMTCGFVQEKQLSFMAEKVLSRGNMSYKKPDMMKLEYTHPFQYIMSLSKGKVYIKDNGKVSKFDTKTNALFTYINDLMMQSVQGTVLENKNFSIAYKESDKQYLIEMTPVDAAMKDYISKVKIYIAKTDYKVVKVDMMEKSGDYTIITFTNRIYNSVLTDESFIIR